MIRFTKHAREKFSVLKKHGVSISRQKVVATVQKPEHIDHSRHPLLIAQQTIDAEHVLRVVYKQSGDDVIIITFYPGRSKQYEKTN